MYIKRSSQEFNRRFAMKSSLEWFGLVACFALLSLTAAKAAEEEKYPERNASAPAVTAQTIRGTFTVRPASRSRRPSIGPVPAIASR